MVRQGHYQSDETFTFKQTSSQGKNVYQNMKEYNEIVNDIGRKFKN